MNPRETTLAAIAGHPHLRVPVAQHNFAFCVKQAGITMDDYRTDPALAARVLADAARTHKYDCIIIDFDTCSLAEALGATLEFPPTEPARVAHPLLANLQDIRKLKIPDPTRDGRLPRWLETTRQLRKLVGDDIAIMARADQGPFGLLFQLRGHEDTMIDVLEADSDLLHEALDFCTEAGVRFAQAQLAAGADLTSIGDSASGESLISPADYARLAQPHQKKYRGRLGPGILSLHICGKTNHIINGMVDTGCEVLELDHHNNLETSLAVTGNRTCVFGNIDPSAILSQGKRDDVLNACQKVLALAVRTTTRFVLCPGCLANADVPAENISAMTEAAARWGRYAN